MEITTTATSATATDDDDGNYLFIVCVCVFAFPKIDTQIIWFGMSDVLRQPLHTFTIDQSREHTSRIYMRVSRIRLMYTIEMETKHAHYRRDMADSLCIYFCLRSIRTIFVQKFNFLFSDLFLVAQRTMGPSNKNQEKKSRMSKMEHQQHSAANGWRNVSLIFEN